MTNDYLEFCEDIYSKFIDGTIQKQDLNPDIFQLDYCPEPYLIYGNPKKPLYVLTTNPGRGLDIQKRKFILKNKSDPIKVWDEYGNNAQRLMEWYMANLSESPLRRLKNQIILSEAIGASGMVQVEAIPFHSPDLPNKSRIVREINKNSFLNLYCSKLKIFLEDKMVIALTAVSTKSSINENSLNSEWIHFLMSTMSCDLPSRGR